MATTVVRVPEEILDEIKAIAAMHKHTPGDAIAVAWAEYVANHKDELSEQFDEIGRILRERDVEAYLARTRSARRARAEAVETAEVAVAAEAGLAKVA